MNAFLLTASVSEISAQRYTPAGIPAIDVLLSHDSDQIEAGQSRKVKLSLKALALGTIAEALGKSPIGKQAKFKGFMAATKNGKSLLFHITDLEFI